MNSSLMRWGHRVLIGCVAIILLAGCGSGEAKKKSANKSSSSGSGLPPGGGPPALTIAAYSGTPYPADGTWIACHFPPTTEREEHIFAGMSLEIRIYTGTTGGATCANGTLDTTRSGTFTITATGTIAFAGWLDDTDTSSGGPPGLTPDPTTLTTLNVTGTFAENPTTRTDVYWVDDRTENKELYLGANSGDCLQQGGVDVCLADYDPPVLQ